MAKKFISTLGTGSKVNDYSYFECIYEYEGKRVKTRYIQKAIIDIFCNDWNKEDEIILYTTELSKEQHIDREGRLGDELKEKNIKFKTVAIPDGKNEKELWEIFDKVFNSLDEGDDLIVDITHGFRTIPMLLIIILNYAKVIKNINVKGIYYGAFEGKFKNKEGIEITPIYDFKMYDTLMEFTNGINTFLNTGNSIQLKDLCEKLNTEACRNKDFSLKEIRSAVNALNDFSNAIMTCRGNVSLMETKSCKNKTIAGDYRKFIKELKNYEKTDNDFEKALTPLFEKVKNDTKAFLDITPVNNGLATIKFCIQNGFVQQGITTLEETMKTFVCIYLSNNLKEINLNCYSMNDREKIAKNVLLYKMLKEKYKDGYKADSIVEKIIESNLINEDLFELAQKVSEIRNDVNHFGMRENAITAKKLKDNLQEYYFEFIDIIEDMMQ